MLIYEAVENRDAFAEVLRRECPLLLGAAAREIDAAQHGSAVLPRSLVKLPGMNREALRERVRVVRIHGHDLEARHRLARGELSPGGNGDSRGGENPGRNPFQTPTRRRGS